VVLLLIPFVLYSIYLLTLTLAWRSIREIPSSLPPGADIPLLSVVIAARNEELTIGKLLEDLSVQSISPDHFEVIVVDDHSTDRTADVVTKAMNTLEISLQWLPLENGEGKKAAITHGVSRARGAYILVSDADCRVPVKWIETYRAAFVSTGASLLFGPVTYVKGRGTWKSMLEMELILLNGLGAASNKLGWAAMANGANMAYKKEDFITVKGFEGNQHIASGDDEFLLRKMKQRYPGRVHYVKSADARVETKPVEHFSEFLMQRKRWAGKWKYGGNWVPALGVFIFYLAFLAGIVLGLLDWLPLSWVLAGYGIKVLSDGLFLAEINRYMQSPFKGVVFLFWEILYPFYAIIIGILSNFGSYNWKGRNYRI